MLKRLLINFKNYRKMDFFDNKKIEIQRATAPEGMFHEVKQRLVQERKQIAQTRRQLAIGAALLLLIGGFNIGFVFYNTHNQAQNDLVKAEAVLNDTYFNNHLSL